MADRDETSLYEAEGTDEEARAALGPRFEPGSGWGGAPTEEAARKLEKALRAEPPEWDIPERYGRDRVMLLGRDPRWAFLYWETAPEGRPAFERRVRDETGLSGGRWELRWGEGEAPWGGPPPGRALSEISWDEGTFYAPVEGPPGPMRAWVGLTFQESRFYALCASPVVDFRDFAPVPLAEEEAREVWRGADGAEVPPPPAVPGAEAIFREVWRGVREVVREELELDAWGSEHAVRRRILLKGPSGERGGSAFGGAHAARGRPGGASGVGGGDGA